MKNETNVIVERIKAANKVNAAGSPTWLADMTTLAKKMTGTAVTLARQGVTYPDKEDPDWVISYARFKSVKPVMFTSGRSDVNGDNTVSVLNEKLKKYGLDMAVAHEGTLTIIELSNDLDMARELFPE
jgi:hypothetical protein